MKSLRDEVKRNQQFMDNEFANRDKAKDKKMESLEKEIADLKKLMTKGQKTT